MKRYSVREPNGPIWQEHDDLSEAEVAVQNARAAGLHAAYLQDNGEPELAGSDPAPPEVTDENADGTADAVENELAEEDGLA